MRKSLENLDFHVPKTERKFFMRQGFYEFFLFYLGRIETKNTRDLVNVVNIKVYKCQLTHIFPILMFSFFVTKFFAIKIRDKPSNAVFSASNSDE